MFGKPQILHAYIHISFRIVHKIVTSNFLRVVIFTYRKKILNNDLNILYVSDITKTLYKRFHYKYYHHTSALIRNMPTIQSYQDFDGVSPETYYYKKISVSLTSGKIHGKLLPDSNTNQTYENVMRLCRIVQ